MIDFFDEYFPLSKKQEERDRQLEEEKSLAEAQNNKEDEAPLSYGEDSPSEKENNPPESSGEALQPDPIKEPVAADRQEVLEARDEAITSPFEDFIAQSALSSDSKIKPAPSKQEDESSPSGLASYDNEAARDSQLADNNLNIPPLDLASEPSEDICEASGTAFSDEGTSKAPEELPIAEDYSEDNNDYFDDGANKLVNAYSMDGSEESGKSHESPDIIASGLLTDIQRLEKMLDSVKDASVSDNSECVESLSDSDEAQEDGFSYEYDERYFAEEETPAYKYPGLYKKPSPPTKRRHNGSGEITVSTRSLLKAGAAIAATVAAVRLLGKKGR